MSPRRPWDAWLADSLGVLERGDRLRELRAVSPAHGDATRVAIDAAALAAWRRAAAAAMDGEDVGGVADSRLPSPSASFSSSRFSRDERNPTAASMSTRSSESSGGGTWRIGRARGTGVVPNPTAVAVADDSIDAFRLVEPPPPIPTMTPTPPPPPPTTTKTLTLFSTNDYLGLSTHPRVRAAAARAAASLGCGPRASALVPGAFTTEHRRLELSLARLKGTEDALLFPTGFAANSAAMAALCGNGGGGGGGNSNDDVVVVFSDELNHASIVDGARLAARGGSGSGSSSPSSSSSSRSNYPSVRVVVYPHNDLAFLDAALSDPSIVPSRNRGGKNVRALVVTDSLFSMDGDFADLAGLVALKRKHGFLLVIDEAHATLVCGPRGGGAAEAAGVGVSREVDVHVGTLSKAFGAHGGFVACSSACRALLANAGRPFAFSTALPAPAVAAAAAALEVAAADGAEGDFLRARVWSHARRLGDRLGIRVDSPIIPVVVGSERDALAASGLLLEKGLHVPAIRPPTVPKGTSRLRISLSAAHSDEDVERLISALEELGFGRNKGRRGRGGGGMTTTAATMATAMSKL